MSNIQWHQHTVSPIQRAQQKHQTPCLVWFTGLSGAGKSTLANALDRALFERGYHSFLLDGDNVRHGLNKDLGFSDHDRVENIRRIGEMAKLFTESGLIVASAFISPFQKDRDMVRALFDRKQVDKSTAKNNTEKNSQATFIEVYLNTPLDVCEQRDPKGLYAKARSGLIKNFTGIDSVYEPPLSPDLTLNTDKVSLEDNIRALLSLLETKGIINTDPLPQTQRP